MAYIWENNRAKKFAYKIILNRSEAEALINELKKFNFKLSAESLNGAEFDLYLYDKTPENRILRKKIIGMIKVNKA